MELWIRSQDKLLLRKPRQIKIYEGSDGWFVGETLVIDYGKYKSKERALEVLDEIQNIIKPKYILDNKSIKPNGDIWEENGFIYQNYSANATIQELSTYIYEMPKE